MADPTANYEWDVPTVGGDTGAWGTILNTLFDSIDSDLFAAEAKADEALAENLEQALTGVQGGAGVNWEVGLTATADGSDSPGEFFLPLPLLRSGQQIQSFASFGRVTGGASAMVALKYMATDGTVTTVSAGHALPGTLGRTTTLGLSHDVDIDRMYYIEVAVSGGVGVTTLWTVQLVLDRP